MEDIRGSLLKLDGIQKVEASLKDQLVTIEGTSKFGTCCLARGDEGLGSVPDVGASCAIGNCTSH